MPVLVITNKWFTELVAPPVATPSSLPAQPPGSAVFGGRTALLPLRTSRRRAHAEVEARRKVDVVGMQTGVPGPIAG